MKVVIWDFNGTILDDFSLCLSTINLMLTRRNLPNLTVEQYLAVFDFPVQDYYRKVGFDFVREPFADLAEEYMAIYQPASLNCPLRANIPDALAALDAQGIRQIVLSATKSDILEWQMEHFRLSGYFEALIGLDDILGRSKLELARDWFGRQHLDPAETCLIGDTTHDYTVAQALQCHCLLVSGGHHSRERLLNTGARVLDEPVEIVDILSGMSPNPMGL